MNTDYLIDVSGLRYTYPGKYPRVPAGAPRSPLPATRHHPYLGTK